MQRRYLQPGSSQPNNLALGEPHSGLMTSETENAGQGPFLPPNTAEYGGIDFSALLSSLSLYSAGIDAEYHSTPANPRIGSGVDVAGRPVKGWQQPSWPEQKQFQGYFYPQQGQLPGHTVGLGSTVPDPVPAHANRHSPWFEQPYPQDQSVRRPHFAPNEYERAYAAGTQGHAVDREYSFPGLGGVGYEPLYAVGYGSARPHSERGSGNFSSRGSRHVQHGGDRRGGGGGGETASGDRTSLPAGVLPSHDARVRFAESQWQVMRALLLRRYSAVTQRPGDGVMCFANISEACAMFSVPTSSHFIVSRPHKYRLQESQGQAGSSSDRNGSLPEVNLCSPSGVIITGMDLGGLPIEGLPETALGWWYDQRSTRGSVSAESTTLEPRQGAEGGVAPASLTAVLGDGSGRVQDTLTVDVQGFCDAKSKGDCAAPANSDTPSHSQPLAAAILGIMASELISAKRFKTKLCHAWLRTGGVCPRGTRCDYAHGVEELRVAPNAHAEKHKQRLCRVWLDTAGAYCPHADMCSFAHGAHELRIRLPSIPSPATPQPAVVRWEASSKSKGVAGGGVTWAQAAGRRDNVEPVFASVSHSDPHAIATDAAASRHHSRPLLCIAWMRGAAGAAAESAAAALRAGACATVSIANPDSLGPAVHEKGRAACSAGDACPFAHGLEELRLPTGQAVSKALKDIFSQSSGAATSSNVDANVAAYLAQARPLVGGLPVQDQVVLYAASGLLLSGLPDNLVERIRCLVRAGQPVPVSNGGVPAEIIAVSASADPRLADAGVSPLGQLIATLAARSPLTAVLLPTLSDTGGGHNDSHGHADGDSGDSERIRPLSRTLATLTTLASTCAILSPALHLNYIRLERECADLRPAATLIAATYSKHKLVQANHPGPGPDSLLAVHTDSLPSPMQVQAYSARDRGASSVTALTGYSGDGFATLERERGLSGHTYTPDASGSGPGRYGSVLRWRGEGFEAT